MRIGDQYVGLGLGDSSEEIRKIKAFMRRKFASYAGDLADTPVFDEAMVTAVAEMQSRYNAAGQLESGKYIPGVVNAETKYVMGYLPRPVMDERPVLLTACGTGVPWWVGPDADVARAVEDRYKWRPIGYRAAPFPMGQSVQEGRDEGVRIINEERDRITRHGLALCGYSQGGIIVSEIWEYDIKPTTGRLHWALPHVVKAVTFGNPMREHGKAWPDPGGAVATDSHGIADRLMVDTPDWWRNYAHKGDLYTDCAGESGEMKTAIYKVVMGARVFSGPDSLLAQVLEIVQAPVVEVIALFGAVMDAGMFFVRRTGPHVNYGIRPAIDFLRGVA
ncbi:lysin B [Mycobacterium phage Nebkiss]|nr:lysin B [Mycobacterium phage Nebkiss]